MNCVQRRGGDCRMLIDRTTLDRLFEHEYGKLSCFKKSLLIKTLNTERF